MFQAVGKDFLLQFNQLYVIYSVVNLEKVVRKPVMLYISSNVKINEAKSRNDVNYTAFGLQ